MGSRTALSVVFIALFHGALILVLARLKDPAPPAKEVIINVELAPSPPPPRVLPLQPLVPSIAGAPKSASPRKPSSATPAAPRGPSKASTTPTPIPAGPSPSTPPTAPGDGTATPSPGTGNSPGGPPGENGLGPPGPVGGQREGYGDGQENGDLRAKPDHDAYACVSGMKQAYMKSPSYADGIEGEVQLKVTLNDQGKVIAIQKIKAPNAELLNLSTGWLRFQRQCKFKPALRNDGVAVPYVINPYVIIFELGN